MTAKSLHQNQTEPGSLSSDLGDLLGQKLRLVCFCEIPYGIFAIG